MRQRAAALSVVSEEGVRVWTPQTAALAPMGGSPALDVLDLRGTAPDPALVHPGADLLLVDDATAWTALAPRALFVTVPPVADPVDAPTDVFAALYLLLGANPAPDALRRARAAADWAAAHDIACGLLDPAGAAGLAATLQLGTAPSSPGPVLDLRDGADLLTFPLPLLQAMADGAPVLFARPTPFHDDLERAGAAIGAGSAGFAAIGAGSAGFAAIEAGPAEFAALPAPRRRALSAAALAHVRDRHSPAAALAAWRRGLAAARLRAADRLAHWPSRTRGMFVLVISDEALNLLDIRVHLPFQALRDRGAIAGYAILRHGEWVFATTPITPDLRFGAIWVQRSLDPLVELMLQALGRPFVYDLDDLLLVSPSYREAFPAQSADTVRSLIRQARVLSFATARLATLAQAHGAAEAVGKTVVTPNLADGEAVALAGSPRTLVWASSDKPALSASRREVERAVRDFCLAHRLAIVCVGAKPPAAFAAAGLELAHVGLLSYAAYLDTLRAAAPGILLGPLDTEADPATQDFIDAKSDVKVIEARLTGLIGVFSRAKPYLDSDLAPGILCDNTYEAWLDGLERARRLCTQPRDPAPFPPHRSTEANGPRPWADALDRARTDFAAADVAAAVGFVRAQGETLLGTPALFDEDDYLRRHRDVRDAVAEGVVASGYRHYVQYGFREGREARRLPTPDAAALFWWTRLLHRVGRLESDTGERSRMIERLRDRAALRRAFPAAPPAPASEGAIAWSPPGGAPEGAVTWSPPGGAPEGAITWSPPGGAPEGAIKWSPPGGVATSCPVCDASGPHPKMLIYMDEMLLHCCSCQTRFYERRERYDYQETDASALLLQLNLEQNAGIHHQTRPLFALDDVASVLDIGCGAGFGVDLAATQVGWRAVGVDPSFYAAAGRATLGADIRQAYLTGSTDLGAPFDLVLASEVIEHLPAPHDFLALLRSHIAPGGTLVLSTPDADAIAPGSGRRACSRSSHLASISCCSPATRSPAR